MNVASLAIAAVDLKLTQSLIAAIDAVAPGLGGDRVNRPGDSYEPRQVIHPEPSYLPRRAIHPTPRILPRPVLHPTPRVANNSPAPTPKQAPPSPSPSYNPIPWPIPPVWRTLPPVHANSAPKILKIAAPKIDILNKGTLVDLFI